MYILSSFPPNPSAHLGLFLTIFSLWTFVAATLRTGMSAATAMMMSTLVGVLLLGIGLGLRGVFFILFLVGVALTFGSMPVAMSLRVAALWAGAAS